MSLSRQSLCQQFFKLFGKFFNVMDAADITFVHLAESSVLAHDERVQKFDAHCGTKFVDSLERLDIFCGLKRLAVWVAVGDHQRSGMDIGNECCQHAGIDAHLACVLIAENLFADDVVGWAQANQQAIFRRAEPEVVLHDIYKLWQI